MLSLFALDHAASPSRPCGRSSASARKINAELSGRLTESFSGVRVVKAYGAEQREALVFTKGAHRLFRNVARDHDALLERSAPPRRCCSG